MSHAFNLRRHNNDTHDAHLQTFTFTQTCTGIAYPAYGTIVVPGVAKCVSYKGVRISVLVSTWSANPRKGDTATRSDVPL
jgi:hypothetical protein